MSKVPRSQGSCKDEPPSFLLATARTVRAKIGENPDLLTLLQQAHKQVDSPGSSDIGPATAHAFLTDTEGQDGTDATVGTKEEYHRTERWPLGHLVSVPTRSRGHSEDGCMESEPAGVSLDTDTALNSQELSDSYMIDGDSHLNEEFDEPLDHFSRDTRKIASLHAQT